ncbi:hypothetical protein GJ744_003076 [Endocarpon pusillum]|uniref:Uncharacterized protein n=1 Tax=Endocarpon pusillum TaxID=364733 RepID=A0A8H7E876_9EURO|nr:hypothetical protein GJ744_003076 [Endocarpon pusillum]
MQKILSCCQSLKPPFSRSYNTTHPPLLHLLLIFNHLRMAQHEVFGFSPCNLLYHLQELSPVITFPRNQDWSPSLDIQRTFPFDPLVRLKSHITIPPPTCSLAKGYASFTHASRIRSAASSVLDRLYSNSSLCCAVEGKVSCIESPAEIALGDKDSGVGAMGRRPELLGQCVKTTA